MANVVLELKAISKSFPGVKALDNLSLTFERGEVHALVGENGAGKSTLMKVIVGAYLPDAGEIILKGQEVSFSSPYDAQLAGISIIYQELNLLPFMSVAENILLGREPETRRGLLDRQLMEDKARELLRQLDAEIDVRLPVNQLSVAQQQLVEIAKALSFRADLIIMDEPSAALTGSELERLFEIIASLKSAGVTILYVSHRLEEIFSIADRVTVLRDGKWMGTMPVRDTDRAGLIRMMVGRTLTETFPARSSAIAATESPEVLRVEGLSRHGALADIQFALHRGEILGVAGLVGSGRSELARAIFGADPRDAGDVYIDGRKVDIRTPSDAMQAGIGFLTEDRKLEGLALGISVRHNIALPSLGRRALAGFVREPAEKKVVEACVQQLSIRARSIEQETRYLSGGNQQKVVLAKWLTTEPQIIIFDEPTRGIDVGAKAELYRLIRQMANDGKAILMISSELPEILGMSDRILVMREGRIVAEVPGATATEEQVLSQACGLAGEPCPIPAAAEKITGQAADQTRHAPGTEPAAGSRPATHLAAWARRPALLAGLEPMAVSAYTVVLALILLGVLASPTFRSPLNVQNLARQVVGIGLMSIGQAFAVLIGGVDLSVGSVVTLVALFGASFMNGRTELMIPAVAFCLALGALAGWLNGLAVVRLRVPAFIATLGTMTIGSGIALAYTPIPVGRIAAPFRFLAAGQLGPVPFPLVLFVLTIVLASALLRRTPLGCRIRAVGGGPEVARLSGIRVRRVQMICYVLCGLIAAVGGLYYLSRMGVGDPNVGSALGFDSLTAVVLGGCSLAGGVGSIEGALGGVLVVALLNNILNLLNVNPWYQQILKGLIILLAVTLSRERR